MNRGMKGENCKGKASFEHRTRRCCNWLVMLNGYSPE